MAQNPKLDRVPERVKRYIIDIRAAVKKFGEYTWQDKGPREVMDLSPVVKELMSMHIDDVSDTLRWLLDREKRYGKKFVEALMIQLQEWDEFDNLLGEHEWLAEYY